jgi:hypothetical protein
MFRRFRNYFLGKDVLIFPKLVKDAEKGPFISFEEHHKKMDKWIQEKYSNLI